jgi:predicted Fe-Mo cluster-binding NifX family protein
MKIAVCAQGTHLDSAVDSRFGRCPYFVIVDSETGESEAFENPSVNAAQGAGIQTARFLGKKNVDAVLTGNIGPNPLSALDAAGIKVYVGVSGTVADALVDLKKGRLKESSGPTVQSHFGLGRGGGRGRRS